jgi:uncharacterized secreted protein with C-terminal beta-propeller domain
MTTMGRRIDVSSPQAGWARFAVASAIVVGLLAAAVVAPAAAFAATPRKASGAPPRNTSAGAPRKGSGATPRKATTPRVVPKPIVRRASALPAFDSCASLLRYARRNARRTAGRTGVPTRAGAIVPQVLTSPGPVALDSTGTPVQPPSAVAPTASADGSKDTTPSFSSTNDQEAGVDEPDIVKTDGKHVFAISDGQLHAIDVTSGTPKLVGTLQLAGSGANQILLRGDRLLVMTTSFRGGPIMADSAGSIAYGATTVMLTEVDVSDPTAMVVRRSMQLQGRLVDARLNGGTARVVVASTPQPVAPDAISKTGLRRYIPRTTLRSRLSGRTFQRSVAPCGAVRHPRAFSGLDLLTVLTIDLDKGLFNVDRDAILAGAQTVYGSATSLYVASQKYVAAAEDGTALPASPRTQISRFDTSKEGETSYAGAGEVPGYVLNQYSLSEYDGALRVASTDEPQWFDGKLSGDSESFVTELAIGGGALTPIGRVGGLGKGERIYAVRFVGDKGYVVTFRQVDPLYTLDLSDKTDPKVLGTLDLLGYSAYLHPISDDLLLGVGIDAGADGRRLGSQLSLFDVSDLRNPKRVALASLGANSATTAEFDPHAFLYWQPSSLAVVPLSVYGSVEGGESFDGAVGFHVGAASLAEAGRITHPAVQGSGGATPSIARSLVVGDELYTLSYAGLQANSLDTLAPLAFAAFPPAPASRPVPLTAPGVSPAAEARAR